MTYVIAQNFELRIPPLLLALVFGGLMWLVARLIPEVTFPFEYAWMLTVALAIAGAFFSISGVISFRRANTTVNPTSPESSSLLVTTGVYAWSRNPMYLGFQFFLFAWAVFLSNIFSAAICLGYFLYLNRFQILPEENALQSFFGAEYTAYKNRVRKWL
jgi:protein-S-isoprenylcysteine O-methyltransferase Ste14